MKQGQRRSRLIKAFFLVGFVLPLMTGTTYVVLEGEQEVGRFEDHDGIQAVKYVKGEASQPAAVPVFEKKSGKDLLNNPGKKFLDFKIEDPDLIRYLNRQPWMEKLREWDAEYGLEENLGRFQPFFMGSILCLLFMAVLLRILRIFRPRSSRKNISKAPVPDINKTPLPIIIETPPPDTSKTPLPIIIETPPLPIITEQPPPDTSEAPKP